MAIYHFNTIDKSIIAGLGFADKPCNYVYRGSTGNTVGTVYNIDTNTYEKIKSILQGDETLNVVKGDKVYIIPGHPLATPRIKEYLKSIGANTTSNISKATVIAGSDDFHSYINSTEGQAKLNKLILRYEEILTINVIDPERRCISFSRLPKNEKLEADYVNGIDCFITGEAYSSIGFDSNMDWAKDEHFITGQCLEIIYNVLSKKLRVVTQESIANNANSGVKLEDEEVFKNIYQMLDSGDGKNRSFGIDILIHCDLTGASKYNLWLLAREFGSMVQNRNKSKSLSYFLEATNWWNLKNMGDEDFVLHAEEEGELTDNILNNLIPKIFTANKNHCGICEDDDFYEIVESEDLSYTIKLKDKWINQLKPKEDVAKL